MTTDTSPADMPERRVRRFCGRLASVVAVALGMSFAIGHSSAHAAAGTTFGGVLASDTEWTTAGSPYIVTSPVQIPSGITLTIDPGVTVEGSGISSAPGNAGPSVFVLNGTLSAVGTADNPIHIDSGGANLIDPDGSGASSMATFRHTVLTDGRAIVAASGYQQYASLNLLDSVVSGMTSYSYLWYNNSDVVKGNVFYHSAGFSIGHSGTGPYTVDSNRFETASTSGYWVRSWNGLVNVNDNSFDAPGTPSVELEPGYSGAAISATSNDWGTTDTSLIASMIYDAHDDITCAGIIPYQPIQDGPDPATPDGILVSTAAPAITGTAQVGSPLTASSGTWGPAEGITFAYQWLANGNPITGATGATYTPTPDVMGEQIAVTVTAAKPDYTNATATSAPTAAVRPGSIVNTQAPAITGTVKVGSQVSVTPGTWSPSAGLTFTYQWLANGTPITGATHSSYSIPASLAGKNLGATVTAHITGYDSAARTSGAKTVANGTFVVTAKPKLSGTAKVGKDLSVTKGTWTPAPTIKIQWYANGKAIAHATATTLKLTSTLKGKTISVTVTASRTGYVTAKVTLKENMKVA